MFISELIPVPEFGLHLFCSDDLILCSIPLYVIVQRYVALLIAVPLILNANFSIVLEKLSVCPATGLVKLTYESGTVATLISCIGVHGSAAIRDVWRSVEALEKDCEVKADLAAASLIPVNGLRTTLTSRSRGTSRRYMMKLSFSRASASTLVRRRSLDYDYRERVVQLSTQNATSYRSTG